VESNLVNLLDKFKIPMALSLVGIVLIIGGVYSSKILDKSSEKAINFPKESLVKADSLVKHIAVDVSGEVVNPGVYQIATDDARIRNAILAAGGLKPKASQEYISKYLNMAQKISDGMKIYIPKEGEQATTSVAGSTGQVAGASTSQVNINTASNSELDALPGIGAVTTAKIIGSRPFQKIEDLVDQKIVSKSVFEKIKGLIVVF
jgi:competence protein ComEA